MVGIPVPVGTALARVGGILKTLLLLAALALPDSVAVTESGHVYHIARAGHVARFATLIVARAAADSAGYRPCRACFAPKARKARPWDKLRGKP